MPNVMEKLASPKTQYFSMVPSLTICGDECSSFVQSDAVLCLMPLHASRWPEIHGFVFLLVKMHPCFSVLKYHSPSDMPHVDSTGSLSCSVCVLRH